MNASIEEPVKDRLLGILLGVAASSQAGEATRQAAQRFLEHQQR